MAIRQYSVSNQYCHMMRGYIYGNQKWNKGAKSDYTHQKRGCRLIKVGRKHHHNGAHLVLSVTALRAHTPLKGQVPSGTRLPNREGFGGLAPRVTCHVTDATRRHRLPHRVGGDDSGGHPLSRACERNRGVTAMEQGEGVREEFPIAGTCGKCKQGSRGQWRHMSCSSNPRRHGSESASGAGMYGPSPWVAEGEAQMS